MSAPVFLAPAPVLATAAAGEVVRVDGPEGRHAVGVRRLGAGEAVELVDGLGRRVVGTVAGTAGRDVLLVTVAQVLDEAEPRPRIVVVQAVPKGDRGERSVELMTEVGVDAVVPWAAARCVAVWRGERAEKGVARWRATAREAAKQSRRARVPDVADLAGTADVVALLGAARLGLVLHEGAASRMGKVTMPHEGDVVVVVGPEGGLDDDERAAFAATGAAEVRLGPSVLRSSTAGAVAAALVSAGSGRW